MAHHSSQFFLETRDLALEGVAHVLQFTLGNPPILVQARSKRRQEHGWAKADNDGLPTSDIYR